MSMTAAEAAHRVALGHEQLAAPPDRSKILDLLAHGLEDLREQILAVAGEETSLPPSRLKGEFARTTGQLRAFAEALADGAILEATITSPRPGHTPPIPDVRSALQPLGAVAVFAASNFPLAFSVLGGDTASALAAGCPVVVKAHPGHPRLSALTAAVANAAVGPGLVEVVHGLDVGLDLVGHPVMRAVGFTGSLAGAQALQRRIDQRPEPIPLYGELGSINPVVVMPQAGVRTSAELAGGLAGSLTASAGQFCTKPGLVLVPHDSNLAHDLAGRVADIGPSPMLTDGIAHRYIEGLDSLRSSGLLEPIVDGSGDDRPGVRPTVLVTDAAVLPDAALDEVFGPVTILVRYHSVDEAVAVLDRLTGSLSGSVQAHEDDDPRDVRRVVSALGRIAGRVVHNGWPTGVAVVPAMNHGGPWPASTNPLHTSVGVRAARRFMRPVCFQDVPDPLLPPSLQNANPWGHLRSIDGRWTRDPVLDNTQEQ